MALVANFKLSLPEDAVRFFEVLCVALEFASTHSSLKTLET
jgi:hypothetical protein